MNQEPVKEEEGRTMAKMINAFAYLECSAKRKEGVKVTYSRFSWCQTQKYSDSLPHSNRKFAQSATFSFSIKNAEKVYDGYWRLIHQYSWLTGWIDTKYEYSQVPIWRTVPIKRLGPNWPQLPNRDMRVLTFCINSWVLNIDKYMSIQYLSYTFLAFLRESCTLCKIFVEYFVFGINWIENKLPLKEVFDTVTRAALQVQKKKKKSCVLV